jgi:hypothetical protein
LLIYYFADKLTSDSNGAKDAPEEDKLGNLESDANFAETAKEKGWGSTSASGARFN